jgi:hypothetical protein
MMGCRRWCPASGRWCGREGALPVSFCGTAREQYDEAPAPERCFAVVVPGTGAETIAAGHGMRDLPILTKRFGRGNWRKMKGFATVRFANGTIAEAEVRSEAHGIGKRWMKVKRIIRR